MKILISNPLNVLAAHLKKSAPVAPVSPTNAPAPSFKPNELFEHVEEEALRKVGLKSTLFQAEHTIIVPNKAKGTDILYQLTLRRTAVIDADVNSRIKRMRDAFNFIGRDPKSSEMILQVWASPMVAPDQTTQKVTPGTPQAGPAAPAVL